MLSIKRYTLRDLTQGLEVEIKGDPDCIITGVATIQQAKPGQLTFLMNPQYRKYLEATQASAVILNEKDVEHCTQNAVISHNPYFTYAKMAAYFSQSTSAADTGIHPSAVIGNDCEIHGSVVIGAHVVIGNNVKIAANVLIGPSCVIGDDVEIAENVNLDAHVIIYHHVKIGRRSRLASGVVVGSDGFGFANQKGEWHKVPQLGSVEIGDDVDIGANTTIDRGAIMNTVIENGVKLDNLIQVGHNVRIGANTVIAGCVGIAGSAVIGKNCMIGGASCINGHITICDNAIITGSTGVSKSITEPGMYSSGIVGVVPSQEFRKNNARFYRLENLMQKVKSLEAAIKEITERTEQ